MINNCSSPKTTPRSPWSVQSATSSKLKSISCTNNKSEIIRACSTWASNANLSELLPIALTIPTKMLSSILTSKTSASLTAVDVLLNWLARASQCAKSRPRLLKRVCPTSPRTWNASCQFTLSTRAIQCTSSSFNSWPIYRKWSMNICKIWPS